GATRLCVFGALAQCEAAQARHSGKPSAAAATRLPRTQIPPRSAAGQFGVGARGVTSRGGLGRIRGKLDGMAPWRTRTDPQAPAGRSAACGAWRIECPALRRYGRTWLGVAPVPMLQTGRV